VNVSGNDWTPVMDKSVARITCQCNTFIQLELPAVLAPTGRSGFKFPQTLLVRHCRV